MTNLLALTRAASDGRGTTRVVKGIELAYTTQPGILSIGIGSTDSIQDLLRSLRMAGYESAALECLPMVRRLATGPVVRLAGHSLGGAVARRLAYMLRAEGKVVWLETYGEPRGFDELVNPKPYPVPGRRYVCGSDPVPRWFPLYSHDRRPTWLPSPYQWSPVRWALDHRLSSYERAIEES